METQVAFETVRYETVPATEDMRARAACSAVQTRLLEIRRATSATVRGVDWVISAQVARQGGDYVLALHTLPHGGGEWVADDARALMDELGYGDVPVVLAPSHS